MSIFQALVLGVVQGLTEFLPVSSSGHLVVFQRLFGLTGPHLLFDVVVHTATLMAVVIYFNWRLPTLVRKYWLPLFIGTIPVGIAGLFFKDLIESLFSSLLLVSVMLMITGVINLLTDRLLEHTGERQTTIGWRQGLWVGLAQMLAVIPGISRSGSTVFMGINRGLSREAAFEFSFLLSLPAVGGATLLQVVEVVQSEVTLVVAPLLVGAVSAFIVGLLSLWLLRMMIDKAKFEWFGWYCVVIGSGTLLSQLL